MKEVNVCIELFKYDELSSNAKERAFNDHEMFLREDPSTYETEDENGNIITKYVNMDLWTSEEIKEYVEESIRINEYWFFDNGEMANTITYTGKHEKAGKIEFKYLNKVYEVL